MSVYWIKKILPRSLLWRAILILVIPIIFVQVIVVLVFVERLFQDVSEQMTSNTSLELNHILTVINEAPDQQAADTAATQLAVPFDLTISFQTGEVHPQPDARYFYDVSGKHVTRTFHDQIAGVLSVDLKRDDGFVVLTVGTKHGAVEMVFSRRRASASNPHQVLVAMALASLLMTTISFLFLKNQVRPITRLARASDAFGKGQPVNFSPQGATEVWAAGRAFLSMKARIERQIEQRTLMLSGVSHDMRTPLTRMKLSLSMMDDSPEAALMAQDVDDMETMLGEFLEFARGDSDENMIDMSVHALVDEIVANHKRSGHEIDLEFVGIPDARTPLSCRKLALQRAIENLISNARRYGNSVRLTVLHRRRHIDFVVEDDGPGIPPDRFEEALRPFSRLDAARNLNKGGNSGLGLSIAADVARTHGGTLELARSETLGGLKATLHIPR